MTKYGIIAAIVMSLIIGAYAYGRHDGKQLADAHQLQLDAVARTAREAANRGAAEAIAKIEVQHVTIRQEIQREILEKPIYRDCRHDDIGLSLVNEALHGRRADSSQLPAADATQ